VVVAILAEKLLQQMKTGTVQTVRKNTVLMKERYGKRKNYRRKSND
jgi:hypothetical protein